MRRLKVPAALALVSASEAGLAWIGPVATGEGAGERGPVEAALPRERAVGGGVCTTGLGCGGVTAGGAAGGGGGGVATGEAVTVRVTGIRNMFLKLFGPDSTM